VAVIKSDNGVVDLGRVKESNNRTAKMCRKGSGGRGCLRGGGFMSGLPRTIARKGSGRDMSERVTVGRGTKMAGSRRASL